MSKTTTIMAAWLLCAAAATAQETTAKQSQAAGESEAVTHAGCTLTLNASKEKCENVTFSLQWNGHNIVDGCQLGITTTRRRFEELRLVKAGEAKEVKTEYTMVQGKKLHPVSTATLRDYTFVNGSNDTLSIEFRVAADGLALRYVIHPEGKENEMVDGELTTFNIKDGTPRWIAAYDPGYEQFFPLATDGKNLRDNQEQRWGYPALAEPEKGVFMLLAESDITRGHAGAFLTNEGGSEGYRVTYADTHQRCLRTWTSPWRLIITGTLADVTQSTMVTDVARPAVTDKTDWIKPAPVSWIYWAHNHGSRELKLIKDYIDLAVTMKWPYMLIDAEWDEMTNGNRVEEALEYAHAKGVKPMLWYNSCTGWINYAPGPKWKLNTREDRLKEFAWLRDHGVVGIKIDFFGGDDIHNNDYCIDILEDALQYNIMVVFHGATIPRGWQRTYPNLMTVEAVYGAEWYNNNGTLTNRAACHNATLPFTRNVIGPMDYTPGTFSDSQHPHITSHGHELALPILFESAFQHMPDRPSSYTSLPADVQQLLSTLPTAWDETRLLDGYPGHHVVMARRSGNTWYIAGINSTDEPMTLTADLSQLTDKGTVTVFADGKEQLQFAPTRTFDITKKKHTIIAKCLPRGGFVATVK